MARVDRPTAARVAAEFGITDAQAAHAIAVGAACAYECDGD